MRNRTPAFAGMFYNKNRDVCGKDVLALMDSVSLPADLPATVFGGLVPHAGWVYSGRLAATIFNTLASCADSVETLVIFGADHTGSVQKGEVYDTGAWDTPCGPVSVDESLASEILSASELFRSNLSAHSREHSIEVHVPLIKVIFPEAKIVPIAVPPDASAVDIGRCVGEVISSRDNPSLFVVGSSDLTHHGGRFGNPGGTGEKSESFASENDRRMLDIIESMKSDDVVPEARRNRNACGAGAIAATIECMKTLGASAGHVLEYTNSYRIVHEKSPWDLDDTTVGYASVVFGR